MFRGGRVGSGRLVGGGVEVSLGHIDLMSRRMSPHRHYLCDRGKGLESYRSQCPLFRFRTVQCTERDAVRYYSVCQYGS